MIKFTHFLALPSLSPHSEEQLPLLENDQRIKSKNRSKKRIATSFVPARSRRNTGTIWTGVICSFSYRSTGVISLSFFLRVFTASCNADRTFSQHLRACKEGLQALYNSYTGEQEETGQPQYMALYLGLFFFFPSLRCCLSMYQNSSFSFLSLLWCGLIVSSSHPFSSFSSVTKLS